MDFQVPIRGDWTRLSALDVLQCFKQTPFYSKECNNEKLKLNEIGTGALLRMVGFEYAIDDELSQTDQFLWVIKYQFRKSPEQVDVRRIFYLFHGVFYEAPSTVHILESRISRITHFSNDALSHLSACFDDLPSDQQSTHLEPPSHINVQSIEVHIKKLKAPS